MPKDPYSNLEAEKKPCDDCSDLDTNLDIKPPDPPPDGPPTPGWLPPSLLAMLDPQLKELFGQMLQRFDELKAERAKRRIDDQGDDSLDRQVHGISEALNRYK